MLDTLQAENDRLRQEVVRLKGRLAESPRPRWAPACLKLSPGEEKVLRILVEHVDQHMTRHDILVAGWKRPLPREPLVHVLMSQIRRKLANFQIRIHSTYGVGHLIDSGMVARIDALRPQVGQMPLFEEEV